MKITKLPTEYKATHGERRWTDHQFSQRPTYANSRPSEAAGQAQIEREAAKRRRG